MRFDEIHHYEKTGKKVFGSDIDEYRVVTHLEQEDRNKSIPKPFPLHLTKEKSNG